MRRRTCPSRRRLCSQGALLGRTMTRAWTWMTPQQSECEVCRALLPLLLLALLDQLVQQRQFSAVHVVHNPRQRSQLGARERSGAACPRLYEQHGQRAGVVVEQQVLPHQLVDDQVLVRHARRRGRLAAGVRRGSETRARAKQAMQCRCHGSNTDLRSLCHHRRDVRQQRRPQARQRAGGFQTGLQFWRQKQNGSAVAPLAGTLRAQRASHLP